MPLDVFKELLLEMPQQRSVEGLLSHVTERLGGLPGLALVRIWLVQPGDVCSECQFQGTCEVKGICLHLVSSFGRSAVSDATWTQVRGPFARFPIGVRKVGRIAASGEPLEVVRVDPDADWVADPDWIRREGIVSFGGQPLVFRGEVLGVLALFSRIAPEEHSLAWLRMIADHLASAIVNARSFEEIEALKQKIELENDYLRREVGDDLGATRVVAQSDVMQALLRKMSQVAPTDANILITGESGTGKEVLAREIHARSRRAAQPMVRVNCAAIPRELFESEFFGHAKGSFTGAARERLGLFQAADKGTLFLDEVSEIPLELQGKLLRVLQEKEYRRVGEEHDRRVDVRIVSASNRELEEEVRAGRFREDLYYRLQVFPFEIPPLRERKADIGPLAARFLESSARNLNRPRIRLTDEDVALLCHYDWPGNCRELQNVIERAVITARGDRLEIELPRSGRARSPPARERARDDGDAGGPRRLEGRTADAPPILSEVELRQREHDNVVAALERCRWKIYGPDGASALLGVKPTTLLSRLKKMRISRRDAH
jgi:transcriptional regulator with GAF, ATPase, and Fis domain